MKLPEPCYEGTEPVKVVAERHPDAYLVVVDDLVVFHDNDHVRVADVADQIYRDNPRVALRVCVSLNMERQPQPVVRGRFPLNE